MLPTFRGRLVITSSATGASPSRSPEGLTLWVHHEAEELRVHDRATIPEMTARHVMEDLLASGQVARMNAGWLVTRPPGSRPTLQRSWGTVCQDGDAAYLVLFLNDRSLLLPLAMTTSHPTGFTSTDDAGRKAITLTLHDWPALNGSTGV